MPNDPDIHAPDADVRAAALDWRSFTSAVVGVTAIPVITHRTKPQLPIEVDPPLHSTCRALINPSFSPARLALLRPAVEALAGRLFTSAVERGEVEFVGDYAARRVPSRPRAQPPSRLRGRTAPLPWRAGGAA